MGVPLDVISVGSSAKSAEAYFLDNKRYYLPDLDLTDAELSQLNYASNSIHLLGELTEEEALRKAWRLFRTEHGFRCFSVDWRRRYIQ